MERSGRPLPEGHWDSVCVSRLQPDLERVSHSLGKIGLLEVCRPIDKSLEQLAAAHERKLHTYTRLLEALQEYLDNRRQAEIFPLAVCIHGLLDSGSIKRCVWNFLLCLLKLVPPQLKAFLGWIGGWVGW